MTIAPFLDAPALIQFHVVSALWAMIVGPFVLFRNRRDRWHRIMGYGWLTAMLMLAVSGLFIPSGIAVIGHMGPIHLFSYLALWGIAEGLWHVRRGNIRAHQASMQSLWFGAMGIAGLSTLLPGRTLNRMIFADAPEAGFVAIALGGLGLALGWRVWLRRATHAPVG